MKKNKLILVLSVAMILVIGMSTAAFAAAADYKTPAEIVAGLTGKTVDEATAARQAGTSYGAQAQEADKLDEFQAERLALYGQYLDQAVLDGKLTQAEADKLLDEMTLRMESCDGTGIGTGAGQGERNGTGTGLCDGSGAGLNTERGNGAGMGMGRGAGNGNGTGTGLGCGSCMNQD